MNSRRHILVAALACAPLAAHAAAPPVAQPVTTTPPAASAPPATPAPAPATAAPATPAPAPAAASSAPPAVLPAPVPVLAPFDVHRPEIARWVAEVVRHDAFSRRAVVKLLAKAQPQPKIIEAMNRPLERVAPWWEYRERLLTPERIDRGVQFWLDHQLELERIAAQYQVPPEYLVAIIGVETFYGRSTGHYRVIDVLSTLAFDYPQRGGYFRGELEQYLLLTRENKLDPLTTTGSYAGAMGVPQFMPSVYRRYAVDADTDRKRDLWGDWDDILASVANYLHEHGWAAGGPVLAETTLDPTLNPQLEPHSLELNETVGALAARGVRIDLDLPPDTPAVLLAAEQRDGLAYRVGFHNFYVITRYNVSARYAMTVHDLARTIATRVHRTPP